MTDILKTDPKAKIIISIVSRKICRSMALKDVPKMSLVSFRENPGITDRYVIKIQAQLINDLCDRIDQVKALLRHETAMGKIYKQKLNILAKLVGNGEKGNVHGTDIGEELRKEMVSEPDVFDKNVPDGGNIQGTGDNGMGGQAWKGAVLWQRG